MSVFTLAISFLITSSLPLFMDLTIHVPMQYCSLQHQTLLSPSDTFIAGHCFCFGSTSLFFLELFLCFSSASYWTPTDLGGGLFFQFHIILPFHTVHGVLKARILKWFSIPFSTGPRFVRILHHDSSILGGPTQHGS